MPTPQEISDLRRLVKFGFSDISSYKEKESKELKDRIKKKLGDVSDREIAKIAKADEVEVYKDSKGWPVKVKTGYPKANRKFRLIYELYNQSIEENYFWVLNHLRSDMGLNEVIKITDMFSAAEQSAMWGNSQARQAIQQDRVANFLRGISDMVKTGLFQLVRELRSLDERLEYYNPGPENDIALKGSWVDLVEGGAKNPGSIYGLSQNLAMVTLPDLFFRTYIKEMDLEKAKKEIKEKVDRLKDSFNDKVREILTRKLTQYVTWRSHTKRELEQRRSLSAKYLRQHYNTIKLYMSWIKPYIRNLKRLSMDERKLESPDMVSAFEGAMVEIEIMARRKVGSYKESKTYTVEEYGKPVEKTETVEKDMYGVVVASFLYRSRPSLNYHAEGYQRGPIHVGRIEMNFRSYSWDEKECENYIKMKNDEIFDLLGDYDSTLKDIFEQFEEEFKKYLGDLGEKFDAKKEDGRKEARKDSAYDPFKHLYHGFKDLFGALIPVPDKKPKESGEGKKDLQGKANKVGEIAIWNVYKNYKKSHGMLSW